MDKKKPQITQKISDWKTIDRVNDGAIIRNRRSEAEIPSIESG